MVYSLAAPEITQSAPKRSDVEDIIDYQPGTRWLACFIAPFLRIAFLTLTLKHIGWLRGQNLHIFHSPSRGHVKLQLYAGPSIRNACARAGYCRLVTACEREVRRSPPACWHAERRAVLLLPRAGALFSNGGEAGRGAAA